MKARAVAVVIVFVSMLAAPLAVAAQPAVHHVGPSYLYPDQQPPAS